VARSGVLDERQNWFPMLFKLRRSRHALTLRHLLTQCE
jgi:hypothetical protein